MPNNEGSLLDKLARDFRPKMIVHYGSSVNQENWADIDLMVVSDDAIDQTFIYGGLFDVETVSTKKLDEEAANLDFVRKTKFNSSRLLYGDVGHYEKIKRAFGRQPSQTDARYQRRKAAECMIYARHHRTEFEHRFRLDALAEQPNEIVEALHEDIYKLAEKKQPKETSMAFQELYESLNCLDFALSYLSAEEHLRLNGMLPEIQAMTGSPKTEVEQAFSKTHALKKRCQHGEKVDFGEFLKTYDENASYAELILKRSSLQSDNPLTRRSIPVFRGDK